MRNFLFEEFLDKRTSIPPSRGKRYWAAFSLNIAIRDEWGAV